MKTLCVVTLPNGKRAAVWVFKTFLRWRGRRFANNADGRALLATAIVEQYS